MLETIMMNFVVGDGKVVVPLDTEMHWDVQKKYRHYFAPFFLSFFIPLVTEEGSTTSMHPALMVSQR